MFDDALIARFINITSKLHAARQISWKILTIIVISFFPRDSHVIISKVTLSFVRCRHYCVSWSITIQAPTTMIIYAAAMIRRFHLLSIDDIAF